MTNLIERLEAAEEGGRELDARIFCMNEGYSFQKRHVGRCEFLVDGVGHTVWASDSNINHYTTSLDAARMLVPEGLAWGVDTDLSEHGDTCEAWVGPGNEDDCWGNHKGPALALCIAALKAREA